MIDIMRALRCMVLSLDGRRMLLGNWSVSWGFYYGTRSRSGLPGEGAQYIDYIVIGHSERAPFIPR